MKIALRATAASLIMIATQVSAADASPQAPVSDQGMVVGTTGAAAVQAGVDILKAGGSAMDAALATAMAQVTMAAGNWVSFAGIMTLVYYDAETSRVYNMNASYNTVFGEDDPLSIPGVNFDDIMSTEIHPSGTGDTSARLHERGGGRSRAVRKSALPGSLHAFHSIG